MRSTTLSNYYLIDWWRNFDFCLFVCWIDTRFCYSYMTWETGGLELASTIILVLQANRLTKCASHPIFCTVCNLSVELYDEYSWQPHQFLGKKLALVFLNCRYLFYRRFFFLIMTQNFRSFLGSLVLSISISHWCSSSKNIWKLAFSLTVMLNNILLQFTELYIMCV